MNSAYRRLKYFIPTFGERAHTAKDFWKIVENSSVFISEQALVKRGYYAVVDLPPKFEFIFLKYEPAYYQWLEAAFHELVHFLIHPGCESQVCRDQAEAEALALVLIIPEKDLPRLVSEYSWQDPYMQILIYRRIKVLHEYGI